MDLIKLDKILENEPRFRKQQVNKLIYQDLIDDWQNGTTLSLGLRKTLTETFPLRIPAEEFMSKDERTIKILMTLEDGLKIEAVLMKFDDRNTVCVSSQVGCPLGCLFCATGKMGFKRNLTVEEIVDQVLYFGRILKKRKEKVTNIVYMGMGEPFLNYDNVIQSIKVLNDQEKYNLGARHISISTAGIVEGIEKFTEEKIEVNLAISLHAPNDELRSKLMPVNNKYPIAEIIKAVRKYTRESRRKVMFEYILLDGINDGEKEASELCKLLGYPLYHLNLIQYNSTGEFKPSSPERVEKFKKILKNGKVFFTERFRLGTDINAACGQLATKNQ